MPRVQQQDNGTQTTQDFRVYKKCTQRPYLAARNKINEYNFTSARIQLHQMLLAPETSNQHKTKLEFAIYITTAIEYYTLSHQRADMKF